jgi:hypothetical protein
MSMFSATYNDIFLKIYSRLMVGRVRLERTTNWLKANCSTN